MKQEYIDQMYGAPATQGVQTEPAQEPVQQQAQEPVQQAEPQPTTDEFGYKQSSETTGNPYSLEQGSTTDTMYGDSQKVELSSDTDLSHVYSDPADQQGLSENISYMAHEIGADQNDISGLMSIINEQLITNQSHDANATMTSLYEVHGENVMSKIDQATALIESLDPRLAVWLEQSGAGDNPKVINHFIRLSQTPRSQARIAKLRNK